MPMSTKSTTCRTAAGRRGCRSRRPAAAPSATSSGSRGPARGGTATISADRRRATRSPNRIGAGRGSSPNSAPELWPWTSRTHSPTTLDRLARRRGVAGDPRLRHLVERHADAMRDAIHGRTTARSVAPVAVDPRSTVSTLAVVARLLDAGRDRDAARSASPARRRARPCRRRARRRDRHAVGDGPRSRRRASRGHGREVRLDRRGDAVDPEVDPVVQRPAPPPCAGPGPRAGAPGRRPRRAARGVSSVSMHHDEPVVVRDRRPRPRRRLDLDLVRGQRDAAQRDRAVGVVLDLAVARGRHHGRDRRPEPLADLRQQRLDPPLDQRPSRRR